MTRRKATYFVINGRMTDRELVLLMLDVFAKLDVDTQAGLGAGKPLRMFVTNPDVAKRIAQELDGQRGVTYETTTEAPRKVWFGQMDYASTTTMFDKLLGRRRK